MAVLFLFLLEGLTFPFITADNFGPIPVCSWDWTMTARFNLALHQARVISLLRSDKAHRPVQRGGVNRNCSARPTEV